ncbi:MAG: SHOCT domain-containing protein [Acidimicrobiales bacterium]
MPFVRRRPLLRAAAVGGVAYMGAKAGTNKAMQSQQAQQGAPAEAAAAPTAPPAPAAPAAAAPAGDDTISRLQELANLHASGVLTDDEFAAAKAKVLA